MWNLKTSNSEKELSNGYQGLRVGEMRRYWSKGKLPVIRLINSGDLMYSMVIIANDTILYT